MDEGPRFFTVEEADSLVSTLEIEFGRIAQVRSQLAPLIQALGGPDEAVAILQEGAALPPGREAEAETLRRLAGELTGAVERVNGLGCLVKDVELGLVDFYALVDGEPAFLCWQFGEPAISHWHPLDEGYGSRRPIEGADSPTPTFLN
ncbi:MAG TPA: DUF2203 domain-containing protein [Anaeromyxobacter sp.]